MRTPLFLLVGFLLLAASMLLGKLFSSNYPGASYAATWAFVALWLAIAKYAVLALLAVGVVFAVIVPIYLRRRGWPTLANPIDSGEEA
jgi:hypothetical protein